MRKYVAKGLCLYHSDRSLFLWLRRVSPFLAPLSVNIVREICAYLAQRCSLIALRNNSIVLYSLTTSSQESFQVASKLPSDAIFSHFTGNSVICLGGQPVSSEALVIILHVKQAVTGVSNMLEARFWPGVIRFGPFIYVFGGKDRSGTTMLTSERFSALDGKWKQLPRMSYSRVAFSPCLFANLIYLPEANSKRKPFESFNPVTLQYQRIPIYMTEPRFFGSVSFIISDTLCFISRSGRMGRWNVREIEQGKQLGSFELRETNLALSSCTPVVMGREVYWVRIDTGELVSYSLDTSHIVVQYNGLCERTGLG